MTEAANFMCDPVRTAPLYVDSYNNFLASGRKLWLRAAKIARSVDLHVHLREVAAKIRAACVAEFIVPHHRSESDGLAGWDKPTPYPLGDLKPCASGAPA